MKFLEVICPGFDGGTDETDNKILWIKVSEALEVDVKTICMLKNCEVFPLVEGEHIVFGFDLIVVTLSELTELELLIEKNS